MSQVLTQYEYLLPSSLSQSWDTLQHLWLMT